MHLKKIFSFIVVNKNDGYYRLIKKVIKRVLYGPDFQYHHYYKYFHKQNGIEIGGPSAFFSNTIKIYEKIKSLDGVNFSSSTVWEGKLEEGWHYRYEENKLGYQYICDAVELGRIESEKYDFLLSCHNLEHIANPIQALIEWLRVIKPGGVILIIVPNKASNFDHNRNITSLEHLLDDFKNAVSEEDLTHLDEILALHDLALDPLAGDIENFKNRSLNNFQNRCLHHHVFDLTLLRSIFGYLNIEQCLESQTPSDYIVLGRKKNI